MMHTNEQLGRRNSNRYRQVLAKHVQEQEGEIIQHYGDGSLCMFSSSIQALRCAKNIQESLRQEPFVPLRIGIHVGDIVIEGNDIYGDGINIASRVESMGVPGSVLLTERIMYDLRSHPEFDVASLGHFHFKNIEEAIEVFALANEGFQIPQQKELANLSKSTKINRLGKAKWILIGCAMLLLAIAGFQVWKMRNLEQLKQDRIAVNFIDYAKIPGREELKDMASHWISNRLMDLEGAQVVSFENTNFHKKVLTAGLEGQSAYEKFAAQTGAVNLLEGQIFKEGDSLLIEAKIIHLQDEKILQRFNPVRCSIDDPLAGIKELTSRIQGWWISGKPDNVQFPPKYGAYKAFLEAKSNWISNDSLAEVRLRESIQADSNFVEAYFLLTTLFVNNRRFADRDEVLALIKDRFDELSNQNRNLFESLSFEAEGDLVSSYQSFLKDLRKDPRHLFANTTGMVNALNYVNRPEEVIELFLLIHPDSLSYDNCSYCRTRLRVATRAYVLQGQMDSAKWVAERIPLVSGVDMESKLLPWIATFDTTRIADLLEEMMKKPGLRMAPTWARIGATCKLYGREDLVEHYCQRALTYVDSTKPGAVNIECNYHLGNYAKVKELVEKWLPKYANHSYLIWWASKAYARVGTEEEIASWQEHLRTLAKTDRYGYGIYEYALGMMFTIMGDQEAALDQLELAFDRGYPFSRAAYQFEPDLVPLFDHPRWQTLLHPDIE